MENKILMNKAATGEEIFAIEDDQHMLAHPVDAKILAEAISKVELKPPFGLYTINLERVVGASNCVETTEKDDVRYEAREGRDAVSRVVYGRKPEPTTLVTVGICTDDDGKETVFTAFFGPLAPKELSDTRLTDEERAEAEAFWSSHALVV